MEERSTWYIIMQTEQIIIVLRTFEAIVKFVKIVNKYPIDIKVMCGMYELDAKSLLGLFSLNPNEPVCVTSDEGELPNSLKEELKCFAQ